MPELHETRMGQRLIEGTLPRIAEALEAIATRVKDDERFSPRELALLYEAVEYMFADAASRTDIEEGEFNALRERLLVMTGQSPAQPTR